MERSKRDFGLKKQLFTQCKTNVFPRETYLTAEGNNTAAHRRLCSQIILDLVIYCPDNRGDDLRNRDSVSSLQP